jgi:hypothetical protein
MEHCTDCEDIIKKMDDDLWFRMDESQKFDRFFGKTHLCVKNSLNF